MVRISIGIMMASLASRIRAIAVLMESREVAVVEAVVGGWVLLRLKAVVTALALSLSTSPASAASWWLVQVGEGELYFVDMETITTENESLIYWQQVVEREPGAATASSSKQQWRVDCARRVHELKYSFSYDRAGKPVSSRSGPLPEQPAVPDTIGSNLLNFVCNPFEYSDTPAMVIVGRPEDVAKHAFALGGIDGVDPWIAAGLAVAASHGQLGAATWEQFVGTLPAAAKSKVQALRRGEGAPHKR